MKLLSCHIENFGKLQDFSLEFTSGLNSLCEPNGFGKSTLASFIRVMLFGFCGETKRNAVENERKRFMPWQGGSFGGSLSFEVNEKQYLLTRVFHEKAQDDEFELRDLKTNLIVDDYSTNIGEELFSVNQESFMRTVFIGQNDLLTKATDDINAKIGNLTDDTNDLNSFEVADKKMTDLLNGLSPKRKTGSVYKLKEEAAELNTQIHALDGIKEAMDEQQALIDQSRGEIEKIKAVQEEISKKQTAVSKQKDLLSQKMLYAHLCEEAKQKENELQEKQIFYANEMPQKDDLERMSLLQKESIDLYAKIQSMQLTTSEKERLALLDEKYGNEENPEAEIAKMHDLVYQYDMQKSSINAKERTYASLLSAWKSAREKKKSNKRYIYMYAGGIVVIILSLLIFPTGGFFKNLLLLVGAATAIAGIYLSLKKKEELPVTREMLDLEKEIQDDKEEIVSIEQIVEEYLKNKNVAKANDEYYVILQRVQNEITEYTSLKAKKSAQEGDTETSLKYEKNIEEIGGYLAKYNYDVSTDAYGDSIVQLKEKLSSETAALETIKRAYLDAFQKKKTFEEEHDVGAFADEISSDPNLEEDLEKMDQEYKRYCEDLEKLYQTIREYEARLENMREQSDELLGMQTKYAELVEEINRKTQLYANLKTAQDMLKTAKENMTQKYVTPLKLSFAKYYELVTGNNATSYYLDANAKVTVGEHGKQRNTEYLSAGYQDLIGLCLRLAFADAMYPDEKPMLILDDPLVNLDADKIEGGKKLMEEAAKSYQLIYFTCHDTRC